MYNIFLCVIFLERVANVDEILGEQFLEDSTPSKEDLMVSYVVVMIPYLGLLS